MKVNAKKFDFLGIHNESLCYFNFSIFFFYQNIHQSTRITFITKIIRIDLLSI